MKKDLPIGESFILLINIYIVNNNKNMADYVVKLTGQDALTPTLKNVKQELQSTGNVAKTELTKITERFEQIEKSSMPVKREIKAITDLMAKMNAEGMSNDLDIYKKMAARAGELTDAIGDARKAARLLSSDTANLDAGIQAFSGLTAAATTFTGVMGLLGMENENTEQAILKVQSALAVLNGVQEIANVLNKDSILMLKLKQIQMAISTATTTANTGATVANTAATAANTIALKAWNLAKAIGKALIGDWTGLLIVGAGALASYAIATSDSTKKNEEQNESIKEQEEAQKVLTDTYEQTLSKTVSKYTLLQAKWKSLGDDFKAKEKFIKSNASEFKNLGLSIHSVKDAEDVFVKDTKNVIQAFIDRATAAAYQAKLEKDIADSIKDKDKIWNNVGKYKKVKPGDTVSEEEGRRAGITPTYNYTAFGATTATPMYQVKTQKEADLVNAGRAQKDYAEAQRKADESERKWKRKIDADAKEAVNWYKTSEQSAKKAGMGSDYDSSTPSTPKHSTPKHSTRHSTRDSSDNTNNEEQVAYKVLNDKIEELKQQKISLTNNTKLSEEEIAKETNRINEEIIAIQQLIAITDAAHDEGKTVKQYKEQQNSLIKDIPNPKNLSDVSFAPEIDMSKANFKIPEDPLAKLKNLQGKLTDITTATSAAEMGFNALGQAIGGTAGAAIAAMGSIANTIAQTIGQVIAIMIASGAKSAMELPFPANVAAAATVVTGLASIISTIKNAQGGSYADGGIVAGTSYHGDTVLARLNSGEAVLNKSQQSKLFNLINSGGTNAVIGQVEFKIAGSTLKGVLRNYDSKMKKIR